MTPVVEARGLGRVHGSGEAAVTALRDVDLEIGHGEFVAVTGPSGCGKSTLLNLLGGLDRPTSGEIELGGTRVESFSEAKWAHVRRAEIGFVFQFFNLIGNLSVADNVELPGLLAGLSAREAKQRRIELLTTLGIAEHAEQSPTRLSGGQQQRVAIARALINRPKVLLADEPTGNLDSTSARDVMALLRTMHDERGQTIVLVTHDARFAARADRVITMRDGTIANETRLDEGRTDVAATVSRLMQLGV
jgi:putative ABC transport system ATP-binding protein